MAEYIVRETGYPGALMQEIVGELVRCRDCKHWNIHKRLNIPWCREMHIDRGAEDFCSNGKRKE